LNSLLSSVTLSTTASFKLISLRLLYFTAR
jgi:hypothetical protein